MDSPTFDRSGCPTEETFKAIEEWPANDGRAWLTFCYECWNVEYGRALWDEKGELELITGGWSDNEAIIAAMQRNRALWWACWQLSERGGRHVFEEPAGG